MTRFLPFRHILLLSLSLSALSLAADVPSGYYSTCENKGGKDLLTALYNKISSHTDVGYSGLWDVYTTSDVDENGKIIDIYSTKRWKTTEKCGNYSSVGDCYNREHTVPQSWFNEASPMKADAFHVYPTDGKVNGIRSNYPFGECANGEAMPSSGSVKGLGKKGSCTFSGYSGTVFEPDDEYKGDIARSYFYMVACYNTKISSWSGEAFGGSSYPGLSDWTAKLMMKWHRQDPVSDKEKSRQEAIYKEQKNRNPFIDYPEMAEYIWGDKKTEKWSSTGPVDPVLSQPVNGATIDCGTVALGGSKTTAVTVRGSDFTDALTVSVSGTGFSCSTTSLTASQVNSGASVNIVFTGNAEGTHIGTLSLTCGDISVSATLTAKVLGGIPALNASNITTDAFTANWIDSHVIAGEYFKLYVTKGGTTLAGFPVSVLAANESYRVEGLDAETTYEYYLTDNNGTTSNTISVTTFGEEPEIYVYTDGSTELKTEMGEPSQDITVFVETFHLGGELDLEIDKPFELSTDRHNWGQMATLDPEVDHFYVRLNGDVPGTYQTNVKVSSGKLVNDGLELSGIITNNPSLCEVPQVSNWEAYALDGALTIDNCADRALMMAIYSYDGVTWYHGFVSQGVTTIDLPAGVYIVANGNDARRVVVQ